MNQQTRIPNNCTNCRFSIKTQIAGEQGVVQIGQSVYLCKRFPPQTIAVPQPGGVALSAQFPVVNELISCHEWKQKPN